MLLLSQTTAGRLRQYVSFLYSLCLTKIRKLRSNHSALAISARPSFSTKLNQDEIFEALFSSVVTEPSLANGGLPIHSQFRIFPSWNAC